MTRPGEGGGRSRGSRLHALPRIRGAGAGGSRRHLELDSGLPGVRVVDVDVDDPPADPIGFRRTADALGLRVRSRPTGRRRSSPVYFHRSASDPLLSSGTGDALQVILAGFRPYPAAAVDADWNVVATNSAFALLTAGLTAAWLALPVNLLKLALHPDGFSSRVAEPDRWRAAWRPYLVEAVARETVRSGSTGVADGPGSLAELLRLVDRGSGDPADGAPAPSGPVPLPASALDAGLLDAALDGLPPAELSEAGGMTSIGVPLRLRCGTQTLSFLATDTCLPVSALRHPHLAPEPSGDGAELRVAAFLPSNETTVRLLHELAPVAPQRGTGPR